MKHFIFFLYVLALMSGFLAYVNLYIVYIKIRNINIKRYLQSTAFFLIMSILSFLFGYLTANMPDSVFIRMEYLVILNYISQVMLIYYSYLLYVNLFKRRITTRKKVLLYLYSILPILYLVLTFIIFKKPDKIEIAFDVWIMVFALYFLFSFLRIILTPEKHFNVLEQKETKKIAKAGTILYLLLSAFASIMALLSILKVNSEIIDHSYFAIFYIIHNILCIVFILKFFNHQLASTRPEDISPVFLNQFFITQREKEIVECVLQGKSNKEIAGYLDLTVGTVKVFIYNIFQKTGAKNRVELVQIARTGLKGSEKRTG